MKQADPSTVIARIRLDLTPAERLRLRAAAGKVDCSMAEFARNAVREKVEKILGKIPR